MNTYRIAGKLVEETEIVAMFTPTNPISNITEGDDVLLLFPDGWARGGNGKIGRVTEIERGCNECLGKRRDCPGRIGVYVPDTNTKIRPECWGFGSNSCPLFGLIPQKKRMLIYRKEG